MYRTAFGVSAINYRKKQLGNPCGESGQDCAQWKHLQSFMSKGIMWCIIYIPVSKIPNTRKVASTKKEGLKSWNIVTNYILTHI